MTERRKRNYRHRQKGILSMNRHGRICPCGVAEQIVVVTRGKN